MTVLYTTSDPSLLDQPLPNLALRLNLLQKAPSSNAQENSDGSKAGEYAISDLFL